MISIFIGENTVERDEAVSSYLSSFKNAHGELSIFKIDAESDSKNDFLDAILSVPFFSDKKLVKVVGLEKNKESLELLLSQQNNIPSNCEVMVVSSGFDGRLKTAQELLKISTVREFAKIDRHNLESWLANYFEKQGAKITRDNIRYLIDRVGEDQQSLYQEANKLALLNTIDKEKIDSMTTKSLSSTVFNLLDAISASNQKKSLEIYNEQIQLGNEPLAILGMISWQLHNIAVVFSGLKNRPKPELMKLSGMSPFVFRKTVSVAERLNRALIVNYLEEAINAEYLIKNKPVNSQAVLKNLILKLTTK